MKLKLLLKALPIEMEVLLIKKHSKIGIQGDNQHTFSRHL